MRTLVIGLDCAAPEILLREERLPHIRRLMSRGCYGRLESVIPPITVPAWMCMATSQDLLIVTRMALCRAHEANAAVSMFVVVPSDELTSPGSCCLQIGEAGRRELRPILRRPEQRVPGEMLITRQGVCRRGRSSPIAMHSD